MTAHRFTPRRAPAQHRMVAGFGLLEAIVALALLAGTGIALFAWIEQSLQSATRLRALEQQARLTLNAQALVETINPAEQPEGSLDASGVRVHWQAEPVEPPQRNTTALVDMPGPWQIGLYRVQVDAQDVAGDTQVAFMQLRTGLRRMAPPAGLP